MYYFTYKLYIYIYIIYTCTVHVIQLKTIDNSWLVVLTHARNIRTSAFQPIIPSMIEKQKGLDLKPLTKLHTSDHLGESYLVTNKHLKNVVSNNNHIIVTVLYN